MSDNSSSSDRSAPRTDSIGGISTPEMWPDALAHLRAKHVAGGRVNYIGGPADSITEGVGASARERGWWSLFAKQMARELGQPTRAIGSAEIGPEVMWPAWTTSESPRPAGRSLGQHGMAMIRGDVATTVQPCDRFRLLIDETTEAFGYSGGTIEIRVDGSVVDAIDCSRSDIVGRLWDSGPLGTFQSRSIEIECVTGGFVSVGHSYFHDGPDGTVGPLFWRNARARFTAGTDEFGFAGAHATWAGALTRQEIGRNPFNGRVIHGGGAIEPDCFLCCTGTNDIQVFNGDRNRIAAAYENLVNYIRLRCGKSPSIGFIVPSASVVNDGDWETYFCAVHDACKSAGAFLIDVLHGVGTHADDSLGYHLDGLHPNDRGHRAWADYVSSWLLSAIQPDASTSSSG